MSEKAGSDKTHQEFIDFSMIWSCSAPVGELLRATRLVRPQSQISN
jgi:hypothetical protein